MRTAGLLASASAGALIALGIGTGSAFAATPSADPGVPATMQSGYVFVSPANAAPGQIVHLAGTCPLPSSATPEPVLETVTSPAFGDLGSLTKITPMAFAGEAALLPNLTTGTYTVEAICSNGVTSTLLKVTAAAPPPPTPVPHGSGGSAAGLPTVPSRHPEADLPRGGDGGVFVAQEQPEPGSAWPWIVGGALVALGTGGAAFAIERHRRVASALVEDETADDPWVARAEKTLVDRSRR